MRQDLKGAKKHFVPGAISPVGWSPAPATPVQAAAAQGAGFGQSAGHVALLRALLRAEPTNVLRKRILLCPVDKQAFA